MRILLCTDGSPHGQKALHFGALLAQRAPARATLLGVLEPREELAHLEQALAEGEGWLAGGPAPRTKVRAGHAAEEILAEARPQDYDLVVVGARGRRGITRFLLGSTSERIARHADVPVLIVRGDRPAVRRVLVCTGGQAPGLNVVKFGARVAGLAGAEVTVLHVMSQLAATPMLPEAGLLHVMPQTPAPPLADELQLEDLDAPAEELIAHHTREGRHLEQALAILAARGVPGRVVVRHGLVVEEVEDESCQGDYDLIVVGAHAAEGWWMRLMLKDVGQEIIGACLDRPVLLFRS